MSARGRSQELSDTDGGRTDIWAVGAGMRPNMKIILTSLLAIVLLASSSCRSSADAESPQLRFTSGVGTIFQDSRGRFWFGSQQEGVALLDGGGFTYFTVDDGLSGNQIRSIQEDPTGTLWFATGHGITSFDGDTFTIHTGRNRTGPAVPVGDTWRAAPDDLWFLGDSGMHAGDHDGQSVYRYDGDGFESLPLELPTFGDAHNPALVTEIVKTDDGTVWIATYSGVLGFDGRTFTTITDQTPGTGAGLEPLHVRSICVDSRGVLWIGNNGLGVLRYDGGVVTNFTEEQGLSIRDKGKVGSLGRIFAIAEDAAGDIWFGSRDNGAWRYDGESLTNFTEADGLTSPMVWTIVRDKDDALWFGMADGSVCRFNGESFDRVY